MSTLPWFRHATWHDPESRQDLPPEQRLVMVHVGIGLVPLGECPIPSRDGCAPPRRDLASVAAMLDEHNFVARYRALI